MVIWVSKKKPHAVSSLCAALCYRTEYSEMLCKRSLRVLASLRLCLSYKALYLTLGH